MLKEMAIKDNACHLVTLLRLATLVSLAHSTHKNILLLTKGRLYL